jgi:hypothetical protein
MEVLKKQILHFVQDDNISGATGWFGRSAFGLLGEDAADYAGDALPVFGFYGEAFQAAPGNGIEAGFAVVLRSAPLGFDPALMLEAEQRGVDGAFVESEDVLTELLDAPGDAEAMKWSEGMQGFEDHEIEGALEDFGFFGPGDFF